jgi:hypothetical protein
MWLGVFIWRSGGGKLGDLGDVGYTNEGGTNRRHERKILMSRRVHVHTRRSHLMLRKLCPSSSLSRA